MPPAVAPRSARGRAGVTLALDLWALLLVVALTWPMWTRPGYGLARDMVFTPRHPWNADALGLGTALPRAVPLDLVLAAATQVLDGSVVFRLAVGGVLAAAGWGAHRLVRDLPIPARAVVATAAVWNPFVVERLSLGQWALLAAYAAMWWLLPLVRRVREGDRRAWPRVVLALWAGSLTPSGGLLLVGLMLAHAIAGGAPIGRRIWLVVAAVAAQTPWLLAATLGATAAVTDPSSVSAFALRAERPGGPFLTALAGGGVWAPAVVPTSASTWWGHVWAVLAVACLVLAGRTLWRRHRPLLVVAAVGFVTALAAHLPGGGELLAALMRDVPGAGLLRDGHKWLAPYVVVMVLAAGHAVGDLWRRTRGHDLAAVAVGGAALLPLVLLPDAPVRTWEALRPVTYPAGLHRAVAVLDRPGGGAVATVPWASYRRFAWGNPLSAADPLPRWTTRRVVVSDALRTPQGLLAGEDPYAARVAGALTAEDPADALADLGVGWVLVYDDQVRGFEPGGDEPVDPVPPGLRPHADYGEVSLYRVPGRLADPVTGPGGGVARAVGVVDAAWLLAGLLAWLLAAALAATRIRRRTTSRASSMRR